MIRLTLIAILSLSFSVIYSQQDLLVFKKKHKTIDNYWKGSMIAFQQENMQWQKGEITKIKNDSFYLRPMILRYNLIGIDTTYFPIVGFSKKDIYALPKKGVRVEYVNGSFQPKISGSHVKWYWVKSGWIFRVGAAGYAGLHIVNGIVQNDLSFSESKTELGIATAVFLVGVLLQKTYRPTLRIGRKYHIDIIKFSN
jgi:hypothetical protein